MARPSDCIYCGKPTGSKEHTFPAALGGRRMSKGILCGGCNGRFSALDEELSGQLREVNGVLGVRGDHADDARPALATSPADGAVFEIDGSGRPRLSEPLILGDEIVNGQRHLRVRVSDERQRQDFIAGLRQQGLDPKQASRRSGVQFFTQPLSSGWKFGGRGAMREIGRIALNFLAHHFPRLARSPELARFKDFVLGGWDEDLVWYDFGLEGSPLPVNPYAFGHRILLGLDGSSHSLYARVSLFSTFDLAMLFCSACTAETKTVITDIDPHANHPPDDISVHVIDGEALAPVSAAPSYPDLRAVFIPRYQRLLKRIQDWHWDQTERELLPSINGLRGVPEPQRKERVAALLAPQRQRILNLQRRWLDLLKEQSEPTPWARPFLGLFDLLVQGDAADFSGLTPLAQTALSVVTHAFADHVCGLLKNAEVTAKELRVLLEGGPGMAIAGKTMLALLSSMRDDQSV